MVLFTVLLPNESAFPDSAESTGSESFELDSAQGSPSLLLTPQEQPQASTSRTPRTKLESISEHDDPPESQILGGAIYTEPQEGLNPPEAQSPFPKLTPLPSPPLPPTSKTPTDTRSAPPSSPNSRQTGSNRPRHPTRESTIFGSPTRPENGPQRWPYSRQTLNHLISQATDTFLSVTHNHESRDVEALDNFWPMYSKGARASDMQMLAALHKNLDVRLLFAGLFSAIVTPFIVESYKLLQIHGPAPKFYGPGGYAVRVNAMWFGSLVFNLITALLAIHCKQWLDGYAVDLVFNTNPDTLYRVCRLRQYRYQGLQKFRIREVIGCLPILLYMSVLFFALGLIDWLWHLNQGIAIYVTVICGLVVLFGIITTVIPMFTTRSPFKTPMSNVLGNLWRGMLRGEFKIKGLMEEEEMEDVDARGETLDKQSFKWLMKNTRDEVVYQDTVRAEKEYIRRLLEHRRGNSC